MNTSDIVVILLCLPYLAVLIPMLERQGDMCSD